MRKGKMGALRSGQRFALEVYNDVVVLRPMKGGRRCVSSSAAWFGLYQNDGLDNADLVNECGRSK